MSNRRGNFKTEKEREDAILQEKARGTSDLEIGRKYGVTFRYIERLITKTQGLSVSALKVPKKIRILQPKDFEEEQTTVWSFKQRGNWATHSGEYRGNWSPYIPRNVILKYSKPGELVLDYFCGAGTTAVECKLLGRRCIALDINDKAIELAKKNIDFSIKQEQLTLIDEESHLEIYEPELKVGDARDLSFLENDSVDLICAHPPYADIIHYTDSKEGDLSFFGIDNFLEEIGKVARESLRVLKPGRQCVILIGDTRKKKRVIPLGFRLIDVYLDAGFKLRELVIKRQHNCKTTGFWYANSIKYNFLLLAHEYLPIFEKPMAPPPLSSRRSTAHNPLVSKLENPPIREKLDELETTTVWILPEEDFEERLNKNVIDRYTSEDECSTIAFISHPEGEIPALGSKPKGGKGKGLLFIKSPFLNSELSAGDVNLYLQKVKEIVDQETLTITSRRFIVIQTQDVRINGYIEPLAKRVVDELAHGRLWLREIIVVVKQERSGLNIQSPEDHLRAVHQYLLVYAINRT